MRATNQLVELLLLLLLLFCFFLLLLQTSVVLGVADKLEKGQNLTDGETLVSAGGSFTLGFFSPGVSTKRYLGIWFSVSSDAVCWVANRERPIRGNSGVLVVSNAGSLVLLDGSQGEAVWSSNTAASAAAAQLLESGNLVVLNGSSDTFLWQSFDYLSDSFLPGMKMGKNLWTRGEWYITSWRSADDPSPGDYRRVLDTSGLPEVVVWYRNVKKFRTGPWNGTYFTGVPEALGYSDQFPLHVTNSSGEITYGYGVRPGASLTRVVLQYTGVVQRLVWDTSTLKWKPFLFKDAEGNCDAYASCGAFGLCNSSAPSNSFCSCVQGFSAASPAAWKMMDASGGCRRNTPLDCANGRTTDKFAVVRGVKLPDTHNASVDMSTTLEQCGARCSANCSCLAYAAVDIHGNGCIIWSDDIIDLRYVDLGQDLYLRLAGSEISKAPLRTFPTALAIAAPIAGIAVALLVIFLVVIVIRRRRPKTSDDGPTEADSDVDLPTIQAATGNFSESKIIGRGGFADVYEGQLPGGTKIAVKRLMKNCLTNKGKNDFTKEVQMLPKLRHPNLVELLFHCREGDEWILVYEYMQNKSLDLYIFGEDATLRASLNWAQRLEIISGIAVGVAYLHEKQVIHRDLKPSNILLDDTWKPKIADFATAKLFIDDQTDPTLVLSAGYTAPEYAAEVYLTLKCDVYSFGIVLLEIVSGKRNRTVPTFLPDAWESWKQHEIEDLVDSEVMPPGPELLLGLDRYIRIGLLCVQPLPDDRPTMSEVVAMLTDSSAQLAMPKKPKVSGGTGPTSRQALAVSVSRGSRPGRASVTAVP